MTFITAEIGINHNGDINIAKKLIDVSVEAGCDAVKFQKRNVEKVYSKNSLDSPRDSPWGTTQRDQKTGLEFSYKQYDTIDKYCKKKKILWYVSCWDVESQIKMRKFQTKHNKVASSMLVHKKLLTTTAEEKKHTFISTGMSTMKDIENAVKIFRKNNCPFELMHSHSAYPMPNEEANLKLIQTLKKKFKCDVGYSGHESSSYLLPVISVVMGATSIERHVTLNRAMYGSDQAASIQVGSLEGFVESVRMVNAIKGDGIKKISEKEMIARKKLRVQID